MARKLFGWAVLAFVLFYAMSNPVQAAGFVRQVASSVGTFASTLAGSSR